jgi:hypothetical protein
VVAETDALFQALGFEPVVAAGRIDRPIYGHLGRTPTRERRRLDFRFEKSAAYDHLNPPTVAQLDDSKDDVGWAVIADAEPAAGKCPAR